MSPSVYPVEPTAEQVQKINMVRSSVQTTICTVEMLPPGRERSLALTKLEEACMWAVKAITHGATT